MINAEILLKKKKKHTFPVKTHSDKVFRMKNHNPCLIRTLYLVMLTAIIVYHSTNAGSPVRKHKSKLCKFVLNVAHCEKKNLTYIPTIPTSITTLLFTENRLTNLQKETFANVSGRHHRLERIILKGNNIKNISSDAFEALPCLRDLNLGANPLTVATLRKGFNGLRNNRLRTLYLSDIELSHLPDDLFDSLQDTQLKKLYLIHNGIENIQRSVFLPLSSLTYLSLNNNNLKAIPYFCHEDGLSTVPYLQSLILTKNHIDSLRPMDGECFPRLVNLTLDENYLGRIPNNTISYLPRLNRLSIQNLKAKKVIFETLAFNSTSLNTLMMRNNIKMFPKTHSKHPERNSDYKNIFRYCPNLRSLDMSQILLGSNDGKAVFQMLKHLTKLQRLSLESTYLATIPSGLFGRMPLLTSLNLQRCQIRHWKSNVFENSTSIRVLYLGSNELTLINRSSFPLEVLNNIQHLSLSMNPFQCTCDLQWFLEWGKKNAKKLWGNKRTYLCTTPSDLFGESIFDCHFSYAYCNSLTIIIITTAFFVTCMLLVVSVVYKFRLNIKYYIYLMRVRKKYDQIPGCHGGYLYDAFVSYNSEDGEWVTSMLVPYLEENKRLKLCLHERDFDPGKLIVDNIAEKIAKSKKIVIVLSNEYMGSHWCRLELHLGHVRSMEGGNSELIILMLEELQTRNISNTLRVLLNSTTFIEWTSDSSGETLFFNRLSAALKG